MKAKCPSWYFRVYALVWVCRRKWPASFVPGHRAEVFLVGESGTVVPPLTKWGRSGGGGGGAAKPVGWRPRGNSRTHTYTDLVDLLVELALERENDSHMELYLCKHLGRTPLVVIVVAPTNTLVGGGG